jgi:DNA-binding NtrC family response regulator
MIQRESNSPISVPPAAARKAVADPALKPKPRRILSISAFAEDHDSLRRILSDPAWRIAEASSCHEAIQFLCRDRAEVILCDANLPDGAWWDILSQIAELTDAPSVIVTGWEAGEALRDQVRALGGYDILPKPFVADEVRHVVGTAPHPRGTGVAAPATA